MYTHMYVHTYTCTHIYTRMCTYTSTHMCMHAHTGTHTNRYIHMTHRVAYLAGKCL